MIQVIRTVDTHTMGEPTRVVIGGIDEIPGKSMPDKKEFVSEKLDHIRTALMHEPRGHQDMFGAIILKPTHPDAVLGVVFMDTFGYLDMCGHGLIGVVTVAAETGLVSLKTGNNSFLVETPAGLLQVTVNMEGQKATSVSFQNVPSFLYQTGIPVRLDGRALISVDISYGGNYFAMVEADHIGLEIESSNSNEIVTVGMAILHELNKSVTIEHPQTGEANRVKLVEFSTTPRAPEAHARNTVVFGNGQIDRSPCGTGTCAKMASLFAQGQLNLNETFTHESIIGTCFNGKLLEAIDLGKVQAVIPEITACAYITGVHEFYIHPEDPLKDGFKI